MLNGLRGGKHRRKTYYKSRFVCDLKDDLEYFKVGNFPRKFSEFLV